MKMRWTKWVPLLAVLWSLDGFGAGVATRRPAIYFDDYYVNPYNSAVCQELLDARFKLGKNVVDWPAMRFHLTWEQLKEYNVLVLVGMARDFKPEHAALLERFLQEGGGILFLPIGNNDLDWTPSRWFLEKNLGFKVFIEQIKNPAQTVDFKGADGRIPFPLAWTAAIVPTPVTEGVKNLWYPADRGPFYYNAAPLDLGPEWKVLVTTGPGAHTVTKADGDYVHSLKTEVDVYGGMKGRKGDFPIVATREFGKGRAAVVSVCPPLLFWGGYIPAFGGVRAWTRLPVPEL